MKRFFTVLAFAFLLAACGGSETASSTSTPSPSREPTSTPAIEASPTPVATSTPTPTATPMPSEPAPTATAVSTATHTPPAPTQSPAPDDTPAPPTPTPAVSQGAFGVATIGPQCPVVHANIPCPDLPWEGDIAARSTTGVEVARTRSDSQGRFNLALSAGDYVVVTLTDGGILPYPAEVQVTVLAGQVVFLALMLDTGIR